MYHSYDIVDKLDINRDSVRENRIHCREMVIMIDTFLYLYFQVDVLLPSFNYLVQVSVWARMLGKWLFKKAKSFFFPCSGIMFVIL